MNTDKGIASIFGRQTPKNRNKITKDRICRMKGYINVSTMGQRTEINIMIHDFSLV